MMTRSSVVTVTRFLVAVGNDQITINPSSYYGGIDGGTGDDTITLDMANASDLNEPTIGLNGIDGDAGTDVLILLNDGIDYNLSGASENLDSTVFEGFERLVVGEVGDTGSGSITLNVQDVIDLTDSSDTIELVLHSSNGTLNLDDTTSGSGFIDTGIDTVSDDGITFSKYVDDIASPNTTLYVANDTGATISLTNVV